jgi:3-hydroxymyristoyl/3-hydroxydecanoyl-(acyl carrier protein) dehydratase
LDVNYTYDRSLIEILIPHRSPFLMVDSIVSIQGGKNPSLLANYTVKDKEPEYSGNGSDSHWPSIYIIEGLGQCCNLLILISALEKGLLNEGLRFNAMGEVLKRLMDDEPDEITRILKGMLHHRLMETYSSVGFLGSADMEITGHARQSQVISYEVRLNQVFGTIFHSSVRAYTNNDLIARGTMVSATRKD